MATFGLVHGGFHGAWCWDRLVPFLHDRGHDTVAMDMPSDDPDATLADYVTAVVDALADVDGPVVLVGHSVAGMVVPYVPKQRPVSRLVLVCPMVHLEGEAPDPPDVPPSFTTAADLEFDGRVTRISAASAASAFYGDCDPADVEWAVARLRPQGKAPAMPLTEPWADVPTSLVICTEDAARNPEYLRQVIAPRLGITAIELPGDHSPFLSRPGELAEVLDELARTD
jgi:alpha-beta hydrolase superfamily lysophospholipase